MTKNEHERLVERITDVLISEGVIRNCTKCTHWDYVKELCKKYNQRPPVKIIVKGCPEFDLDPIPF